MSGKVYGCSSSQAAIVMQEKYSLHKGMCNIPILFTVDQEIDKDLFKKAVDIEIERNDALRNKVTNDKKSGVFEQTFIEPYKYEQYNGKIEEYDFSQKTKEAQEKCLKKLAGKELEYRKMNNFKVAFIKTYDNKNGIFFAASHMICDSWGTLVTLTDILDVYISLKDKTELPKPLASYEACLAKELESQNDGRDKEDLDFILKFYEKLGAPQKYPGIIDTRLPHKSREGKNSGNNNLNAVKALLFDKSTIFVKNVPAVEMKKWQEFCSENSVPFTTLLMLGYITYFAKINNSNDVFFNNVCARRATIADKRSAGCRMNPTYPRFFPNDSDSVLDVCTNITDTVNQFYRHSGISGPKFLTNGIEAVYPYINAYNYYGSSMFSVVAMPYQPPKGWNCEFTVISAGHFALPQYVVMLVDIEGNLKFNIEYQLAYTNEIQLNATVTGICDAINSAITDKNKTFKQIKDSIK